MIGLNFVFEKEELLYSLKLSTQIDKKYSLDYFDFDTQNFEDLIDYLEFLEFDQYIFIALAENNRLNRLANYLQEQVNIEIKVVNIESLDDHLEIQNLQEIKSELKNHDMYQKIASINIEQVFENGFKAFKTAIYPQLTRGVLKHLYVDDIDKFVTENGSLLRYFAVNSAIYTEEENSLNSLPIIVKSLVDFEGRQFVALNGKELNNAFQKFIQNGRIEITDPVLDYGVLLGISNFNSLHFKNGQFYLDSQCNLSIGVSGESYNQLSNQVSLKILKREEPLGVTNLKYLFPILLDITHIYGGMHFITPYNTYKLPPVNVPSSQLSWIAFWNKERNFALNIKSGRLFKVNEPVIEKLEMVIKEYSDTSARKELQQVKEMLRIYG